MAGEPPLKDNGRRQIPWKPVVLITVVVVVVILARVLGIGERFGVLRDWIAGFGVWGPLVYIAVYTLATIFALPGSALTVFAGALFGTLKGLAIVSVASTLGASLAFLISRYIAREAFAAWLEDNEKFRRLDVMTEQHGAVIVALTRLVPLFPFNVLNYGFGLTRVRFWTYVFWSWLCMLPGTVLYVAGADAVFKAFSGGGISPALIAVLLAAVVVVAVLVRYARGRIETMPGDEAGEDKRDE